MFHNSELYETEFGLGVRATIDMAPGDLVWVESEGARETRAVIGDRALYARASEVSSRLKRFGFELPDRRMAVMGWVAPYVRGEIDHVPLEFRPDNGGTAPPAARRVAPASPPDGAQTFSTTAAIPTARGGTTSTWSRAA